MFFSNLFIAHYACFRQVTCHTVARINSMVAYCMRGRSIYGSAKVIVSWLKRKQKSLRPHVSSWRSYLIGHGRHLENARWTPDHAVVCQGSRSSEALCDSFRRQLRLCDWVISLAAVDACSDKSAVASCHYEPTRPFITPSCRSIYCWVGEQVIDLEWFNKPTQRP